LLTKKLWLFGLLPPDLKFFSLAWIYFLELTKAPLLYAANPAGLVLFYTNEFPS
jgi:hypothetical protein